MPPRIAGGRSGSTTSTTFIRKVGGSGASTPSSSTPRGGSSAPTTTAYSGIVPPPRDASGKITEYYNEADKCPVCRSDRFLNPKLRLLVSKCYHKLCESCIDRIYTLGPAPCPKCGQTLRKSNFMAQTFEDLGVEKEVVIRKRLARIFNKTREEFEDLKAYNNYLEELEEITFNLIHGEDIEATDRKIKDYENRNRGTIEANLDRQEQEAQLARMEEQEEKRQREQRAKEFQRMDEEERLEREKEKQMIMTELESSDKSADKVVARSKATALKRSTARLAAMAAPNTSTSRPGQLASLSKLARPRTPVSEAPEDVLADIARYYDYSDIFTLKSEDDPYFDPNEQVWENDPDMGYRGGGFDVQKVWERSVRSAVMGLWIKPPSKEGGGTLDKDGDGDIQMST